MALAECCIAGSLGCEVWLDDGLEPAISLFSESQGRVLVSVPEASVEDLEDIALEHGVPYSVLGTVGGMRLLIGDKVDLGLDELRYAYEPTLERLVHGGTLQTEELREG